MSEECAPLSDVRFEGDLGETHSRIFDPKFGGPPSTAPLSQVPAIDAHNTCNMVVIVSRLHQSF